MSDKNELGRWKWADPILSASLAELCSKGEGQYLEFKEKLPQQGHDIGKSIAAFASSGGGQILYGVANDGEVVGLSDAASAEERDRLQLRIMGAARDVKPPVHPSVSWAVREEKAICVVKIETGFDAVYYSNFRPMVRRGPVSRPAEPGEVEKIFRDRYVTTSAVDDLLPSTTQIAERMHVVLERLNQEGFEPFTVVDLAKAMGLAAPAELDRVMSGRQAPTFALLDRFCSRFAIDKEWLAAGRGEAFSPQTEHRSEPEDYFSLIEELSPEMVFLVRSSSPVGEACIVIYEDDFKAWRLPGIWHVSDHVGGGGASDLLSLYRLFSRWSEHPKPYMVLGRAIAPKAARALFDGKLHPGAVRRLPLNHWWDDLTDLDHKWTTRKGIEKAYGKNFVMAQDIVRNKLNSN